MVDNNLQAIFQLGSDCLLHNTKLKDIEYPWLMKI